MGHNGFFGAYGGRFVPETLIPALDELDALRTRLLPASKFRERYGDLLSSWAGRPTPIHDAQRLAEAWGGTARILLKREDLNHTGAHKILNALGQGLLAQMAGKRRIVAETGAGQHGVAVASVCAMLDLQCVVYMGAVDMERQAPQRRPNAAAGGGGGPRHEWNANSERRHQRGHSRLGDGSSHHSLPDRLGRRATSVSASGEDIRLAHRQGGAPADAKAHQTAAPRGHCLRGWRFKRHRYDARFCER